MTFMWDEDKKRRWSLSETDDQVTLQDSPVANIRTNIYIFTDVG